MNKTIKEMIKKIFPILEDVDDAFILQEWSRLRENVQKGMLEIGTNEESTDIGNDIRIISSIKTSEMICSLFPYIASPYEVIDFFHERGMQDSDAKVIVDTIIAMKNDFVQSTGTEGDFRSAYRNYCMREKETNAVALDFNDFCRLKRAVISFTVDLMCLEINLGYASRDHRGELIINSKGKGDDIPPFEGVLFWLPSKRPDSKH